MKRALLTTVFLLAGISIARAQPAATQPAAAKPNFVLIIADDCTFTDLGVYGGQAATPNLQRLAHEGTLFQRCTQSAPMCSPTRSSLYTGQYPVKTGAYPNHTFVKPGVESIANILQHAGYRTALSGKLHVAPKESFPFEFSQKEDKGKNPDFAAMDTFFKDRAADQTPFLMVMASNEPHSPWNQGDPSKYPPESLKLPPIWVDTPLTRRAYSRYLAEVTFFDDQVGRALKMIDEHHFTDSTLVMVVSEQGNSFPFAKWTCYEPGVASGMLVRYPGHVPADRKTPALVEYVDVVPTFLDYAGVKPPATLDGQSFRNVLTGQSDTHKQYTYSLQTSRGIDAGPDHYAIRSVRSDRYRLIWNLTPEATFINTETNSPVFDSWRKREPNSDLITRYQHRPKYELFDLQTDPWNIHNLAEDPAMQPVIIDLRTHLEAWMKSQGDTGEVTEMDALNHQSKESREE